MSRRLSFAVSPWLGDGHDAVQKAFKLTLPIAELYQQGVAAQGGNRALTAARDAAVAAGDTNMVKDKKVEKDTKDTKEHAPKSHETPMPRAPPRKL